ncbi:thioesterase family protein [Tepidamorphus sp. 3E244]|uniref:thioesterase family protein n=1 Tax=Tepidamorphus sp. 3E244 TaxID=3385498 RepID=UPI0038FCA72E
MSQTTVDSMTDPAKYPAPFRCCVQAVEPQWIDYNGHLNMAFYNVLFDRAFDEVLLAVGLGPEYLSASNHSTFTAEAHVTYIQEIGSGDEVTVTLQLLDFDEKRMHTFQEMYLADGTLVATSEQMSLHVDMSAKKVAAYPPEITDRLTAMRRAHGELPNKPQVGHVIGIRRKPR